MHMGRGQAIGGALRPWKLVAFASIAWRFLTQACLLPTWRLVPVRKVEHSTGRVAWRTPQITTGAGLVQHCSASSWPLADMVLSMMSTRMMWRCGLHFGGTLWPVHPVLGKYRMPLHATWRRSGSCLLLCAGAVVGINVLRTFPSSNGSSSARGLGVGSTWYRSWLALVFVLCPTACLVSNGGSGARYVTRKSSMVEGRWLWLPRCCMLPTRGKACRSR